MKNRIYSPEFKQEAVRLIIDNSDKAERSHKYNLYLGLIEKSDD